MDPGGPTENRPAGAAVDRMVRRPRRRRPATAAIAGAVATVVAIVIGLIVVGLVVAGTRGGDPFVPPGTVVRVGTAAVDLGPRPAGASGVELTLVCRTAGTFTLVDGTHLTCGPGDALASAERVAGHTLRLPEGVRSTVVTAAPGARWSMSTTWSTPTPTPTPWTVNADGDTYGVVADDGSFPDLVAVLATNGTTGYARAGDLGLVVPGVGARRPPSAPRPPGPQAATIPVYTLDGTTVVGEFQVG